MNNAIDNLNYANDPRTQGPAEKPIIYMYDEDDREVEVELPTKKEVCPVCNGTGTHVNPSIDAGGLTHDDFQEDPDFMRDYMSGVYDQVCNRCGGKNVVDAVDWDALTEEQADAYQQQLEEEAAVRAEHLAELAMGC